MMIMHKEDINIAIIKLRSRDKIRLLLLVVIKECILIAKEITDIVRRKIPEIFENLHSFSVGNRTAVKLATEYKQSILSDTK